MTTRSIRRWREDTWKLTVSQQRIVARELGTNALVADHTRSFARGIVVTDPAHQHKLDVMRGAWRERQAGRRSRDVEVEIRSLDIYDGLVA